MAIGNIHFRPSIIEDTIYEILDSDPEFIYSSQEYTPDAINKVFDYMSTLTSEWSAIDDDSSVSICWIEAGHLRHIVINYHK